MDMDLIMDEMVEAALNAGQGLGWGEVRMRAALSAVAPLIAAEAEKRGRIAGLEEAEKECHALADKLLAEASEMANDPERKQASMLRDYASSGVKCAATAIAAIRQRMEG
jgi:hypothetical protein